MRRRMLGLAVVAVLAMALTGIQVIRAEETPAPANTSGDNCTAANVKIEKLFNSDITAKDLKERVVFVLYWGKNCPICLGEMPKLKKLQEDLGRNPAFLMMGFEHQNSTDGDIAAYTFQQDLNFPVGKGTVTGYAPKDLPSYMAFKHDGTQLFKGSGALDDALLQQLTDAVKLAPNPLTGPGPFKKCQAYVKQIQAMQNLGKVLADLRRLSGNAGGGDSGGMGGGGGGGSTEDSSDEAKKEAADLYDRLNDYAERELKHCKSMSKTESPIVAYDAYGAFAKTWVGDQLAKDALEAQKALEKDDPKQWNKEKQAWGAWLALQANYEKNGVKNEHKVEKMRDDAQNIIDKLADTGGARKAKQLLDSLPAAEKK